MVLSESICADTQMLRVDYEHWEHVSRTVGWVFRFQWTWLQAGRVVRISMN